MLVIGKSLIVPEQTNNIQQPRTQAQADRWSAKYRNWTYYPDWAVPPVCLDNATCYPSKVPKKDYFSDIAQVWRVPGSNTWSMSFTFYDGVGYQTAIATSTDLLKWDIGGVIFSPRQDRPPLDWNATPGDFDYGGSAFVGVLVSDYNVTAPRELKKLNGKYWTTYFGQPSRYEIEPPPGATGLASSTDGVHWERALEVPMMDTYPAHGAKPWEQNQQYAHYLLYVNGTVYDYYNANSGSSEQSGLATLADHDFPGVHINDDPPSRWIRDPTNPILPNGPTCIHQAADPKVYWDGEQGVWIMIFFGTDPHINGGRASINIAFSTDMRTWTKATHPLYMAGGHPQGLDKCECHKVWLTGDGKDDGTIYMYYTADSCSGRGIALLTSKPVKPVTGPYTAK